MKSPIGRLTALHRYPVKSMAGERLATATLTWQGIDGDRRLALRRTEDRSAFPWLTAGKFHDLVRYRPVRPVGADPASLPTHVRTPEGRELPLFGEELAAEIGRHHGSPVQMMTMKHGVFDEASVSLITSATVDEIGRLAACPTDERRFRPNLVVQLADPAPFQEDAWVGGLLIFGDEPAAPAVGITLRDIRCAMLNLDPDTALPAPQIMKTVAKCHENTAGVYGSVLRTGALALGQPVFFHPLPPGAQPA